VAHNLHNTSSLLADPNGQAYKVNFVNNSNNAGTVYMFQTNPGPLVSNVTSLAWFSYGSNKGDVETFQWTILYGAFWSASAALGQGVVVTAGNWAGGSATGMALTSLNETTLSQNAFGFILSSPTNSTVAGITIMEDNTVQPNVGSIGIGMGGAPVFAIPAQPNLTAIFTPTPTYWIAFALAPVQQGAVVATQTTSQTPQILFPPGNFTATATLNALNAWTIAYSP